VGIANFTDVDVIEVLVSAGDRVETDDPLITLESDKATMDVPSPHGGVVKDLKIKVGDKVSEGDAIVTLDVADGQEGGDVAANEVSPKSAGKSAPERAEAEVEATEPAKEREKRAPAKAAPVAGPAASPTST
jgi:pyruvate dehydrogenase E2 component (dihydrolipoamide acetyltransferase)